MKKNFILSGLVLSVTLLTTLEDASAHRRCRYNRWGDYVCKPHRHHRHTTVRVTDDAAVAIGAVTTAVGVAILADSCAPEVAQSNISATDKAVLELAQKPEFAADLKFQQKVKAIVETKEPKEKMTGYFGLVDVQSSEDVAYFVGARKDEYGKYAYNLSKNTDLSLEKAEMVVEKLSQSLKGTLK